MRTSVTAVTMRSVLTVAMLFGIIILLSIVTQIALPAVDFSYYATPIAMCLTAVLMPRLFDRGSKQPAGWRDASAGGHTLAGAIAGTIVIALAVTLLLAAGSITLVEQPVVWRVMLSQAAIMLAVASAEEWLFRGYLFGIYRAAFGMRAAVILNAVLFTAIHLVNPDAFTRPGIHIALEMANIFLMAVMMSQARAYSGSLWMPIGLHLFLNIVQSIVFGFPNGGKLLDSLFEASCDRLTVWNGAGYGLESSLVLTPVLIAGVILFGVLLSRQSAAAEGQARLH